MGKNGMSTNAIGASSMRLWHVFASSRLVFALSLMCGLIAGGGNAALVTLINRSLEAGQAGKATFATAFFVLCVLVLASSALSMTLLSRLAQANLYNLRLWLSRRILAAPFQRLQSLGPHRLMAALTDDIGSAVDALDTLPTLFIAGSTLLAIFIYLGFLSPDLLLLVLLFLVFGIVTFRLPQSWALHWLQLAREADNVLFGHFRAIVEGCKELKMDVRRRRAFLDEEMSGAADTFRRRRNRAWLIYVLANRWAQSLYFILIGLILFASPSSAEISRETLTGFTLAILFLGGPISAVVQAVPMIGTGIAALKNIEALGLGLGGELETDSAAGFERQSASPMILELCGVRHHYPAPKGEIGYQLGPLNLRLQPGELVFVTGGNGSGKTTLALLILGLFLPEAGEIKLGGQPVTKENLDSYRQNFSAVFADAYVFDSLLGYSSDDLLAKADELLLLLQLDRKLRIEDGRYSTVDLSRGQRKRLALLGAYLADRPFYLFDEWAAEQDPVFREFFYQEMLPKLKARGKTVIVITHDDRYFHLSDRLLQLTMGQLEEMRPALAASA